MQVRIQEKHCLCQLDNLSQAKLVLHAVIRMHCVLEAALIQQEHAGGELTATDSLTAVCAHRVVQAAIVIVQLHLPRSAAIVLGDFVLQAHTTTTVELFVTTFQEYGLVADMVVTLICAADLAVLHS
jgi:hypothetical protein